MVNENSQKQMSLFDFINTKTWITNCGVKIKCNKYCSECKNKVCNIKNDNNVI